MIMQLRQEIAGGGDSGWTLSQRGGGSYRDVIIDAVDEIGISCRVKEARRFIPWTSINEVYR